MTCLATIAAQSVACQRPQTLSGKTVESRDSNGQLVELIDSTLTLRDGETWLALKPPFKTAFPYSLLCLGIPDGYRHTFRPLAMMTPSGQKVVISAQVRRSDGSSVPMQFMSIGAWRSVTGGGFEYCLKSYLFSSKEGEGFPVGTTITGLTLRSNMPVTIRRLVWTSTR